MRALARAAAVTLAMTIVGAPAVRSQGAQFPARLEKYLSDSVRVTPAERKSLLAGAPVTKFLDSDPSQEVALFGAVWVAAPADLYVRNVSDIEQFERGGSFLVTKKISDPPVLEDFAKLALPEDDFQDLKKCKPGSCNVKLPHAALERISKVDWSRPTARAELNGVAKSLALDYVKAYRDGGNAELAVYRDQDRPTFVATEFESMVSRMPELTEYLPDLHRYLLQYPKATLPNSTSFLYWQEAAFGLKPTIRISHVVIASSQAGVAVASKLIYASHYFWTALELRVLVLDPARGPGFWFVNITRSRSDGLSGFVGKMIRGKVRGEARGGLEAVLKVTKTTLEQQARQGL